MTSASELTLVLGGARSGKSAYARSLCRGRGGVVFVATASAGDDEEMAARIRRHRSERPREWVTIEAPLEVAASVRQAEPSNAVVLVDCVTLWISNLLLELHGNRALDADARESRVLAEARALVEACRGRDVVLVSNEVGGGIVPETPLGREFRDLQGRVNQVLAEAASRVVLLVAGIPLTVKG